MKQKNSRELDGSFIIYFFIILIVLTSIIIYFLVHQLAGFLILFFFSMVLLYSNSVLMSKNQSLEDENNKYYEFFVENKNQISLIHEKLNKLNVNDVFSTDPQYSYFFKVLKELLTRHKLLLYNDDL